MEMNYDTRLWQIFLMMQVFNVQRIYAKSKNRSQKYS